MGPATKLLLGGRGMPTAAGLRREHVEAYLVEVGEVEESPLARMRPPKVAEEPVPVLSDDELVRLLRTCVGKGFEERRDQAILRLFVETGMRLSELTFITLDDLDFDQSVAHVLGKGGRPRACVFGDKTALALRRYVRERSTPPPGRPPALGRPQGPADP